MAPGQGLGLQDNAPKIMLVVKTAKIAPGKIGKGVVTIQFADGWHGYQNPPTKDYQLPVTLKADKALMLKVAYPLGVAKMSMGEETALYEGKVEFPFTFKAPMKLGKHTIKLTVSYQQCDENSCLPPSTVELKGIYTVAKAKS